MDHHAAARTFPSATGFAAELLRVCRRAELGARRSDGHVDAQLPFSLRPKRSARPVRIDEQFIGSSDSSPNDQAFTENSRVSGCATEVSVDDLNRGLQIFFISILEGRHSAL